MEQYHKSVLKEGEEREAGTPEEEAAGTEEAAEGIQGGWLVRSLL
jgi:hypothetical protein